MRCTFSLLKNAYSTPSYPQVRNLPLLVYGIVHSRRAKPRYLRQYAALSAFLCKRGRIFAPQRHSPCSFTLSKVATANLPCSVQIYNPFPHFQNAQSRAKPRYLRQYAALSAFFRKRGRIFAPQRQFILSPSLRGNEVAVAISKTINFQ